MSLLNIQYPGSAFQLEEALESYVALHKLPISIVTPSQDKMVLVVSKMGTSRLHFFLDEAHLPEGITTQMSLTDLKLAWLHKAMASKIMDRVHVIAEAIGAKVIA